MVKKHLFTSIDVANGLNARVQEEIDPRLFLTANFKLPADVPPSPDGKYYQYVQTLYRFAIDTSAIIRRAYGSFVINNRIPEDKRPKSQCLSNADGRFDDLRSDDIERPLGCIQVVRACIDHNVSEDNGAFEKDEEDNYKKWLIGALDDGKEKPEDRDDYDRLCVVLELMADRLVDALSGLITAIAALDPAEKQEVVKYWIDATLEWYGNSQTRHDFYLGQMAQFYEADAIARRRSGGLDKRRLRTSLEIWLRNYFEQQSACPQDLRDRITSTSPEKDKCATKAFFGNGYTARLKETLEAYTGLSMLPQDLMQQDIADRLEEIPKMV